MTLEFTTAAKRYKPITFTLDGEEFTFNRPKDSMLVMSVWDGEDEGHATFKWLDKGLGEEQAEKIKNRLRDLDDDFDFDDLKDLIKKLLGEVSGRPTG